MKRKMRKIAMMCGIAVLAAVGGCATTTQLSNSFDASAIAWASGRGTNTITGAALMRTVGGEARTCAARSAELIPDSPYARERMQHLYGSTERGHNPAFLGRSANFTNDHPGYHSSTRSEVCDAQGQFVFSNIPDGSYFIVAEVIWMVPGQFGAEGGYVMQRVSVSGGETRRVVISP